MSQSVVSMSQPGKLGGTLPCEVGLRLKSLRRKTGTSRMSREAHVRICRGLVVKFHRSTWQEKKAWQETMSGEVQGDERKRTIAEVSK